MEFLPAAFTALGNYQQFVVYQISPSQTRPGKNDKIPIHPEHKTRLKWGDPQNWTTSDNAIAWAKYLNASEQTNVYGVGFIFTEQDPFFFLDIDNCLEPCGTKWSDLAMSLIGTFPGAAIEVSSSGRGLHIIASGNIHQGLGCKNEKLGIELYSQGRFVALTGMHANGDAATNHTTALGSPQIHAYFSTGTSQNEDSYIWEDRWETQIKKGREPTWNGSEDDAVLFNRMIASKSSGSIFGGKINFEQLWNADVEALMRSYPDKDGRPYNESSADAALAQHLAFWTGNDCDRMLRIMKQSKLYREKWERPDYLPRTILSACAKQKEWLCDRSQIILPQDVPATVTPVPLGFLNLEQQIQLFKGCTYICDRDEILMPGGFSLKPSQFKAMYGGRSFPMDAENARVSRNAWEAFTEHQLISYPKAHSSTFLPAQEPGIIIQRDGRLLVNEYWPIETPRKKGDVSLFLRHLDKLILDPRDQVILICYMAACIRYKGIKFNWCPVIQGVQGNGKTLLTLCVAAAIGDRYVQFPAAQYIAEKFNSFLYKTILIGIEDIYVADKQRQINEALKPMITGKRQGIEPKGKDKDTRDICCNFMINSNHKDGLRIEDNERRFAPFYTAQQRKEDLRLHGLTADYFSNIFNWLERREGYAMVAQYLDEYEIPDEFNPSLGGIAPITTSSVDAITHGLGKIEQEIIEAIEQEQLGFRKGWISSIMLDNLLTRLKANGRIPLNKRRDMLRALGYDWHPGLKEGRVNNVIMPDGGKPRLFIKDGKHGSRDLSSPAAIAKMYTDDQTS